MKKFGKYSIAAVSFCVVLVLTRAGIWDPPISLGNNVSAAPPPKSVPSDNEQLVRCLAEIPGSTLVVHDDGTVAEVFVLTSTAVELRLEYKEFVVGAFAVRRDETIVGWEERTKGTGILRKLTWDDYEFRRKQMLIHFC